MVLEQEKNLKTLFEVRSSAIGITFAFRLPCEASSIVTDFV